MQTRQIGILAETNGRVWWWSAGSRRTSVHRTEVLFDGPAVRVETNKATGETTVDAPFAHVEKDANGTHVQAPGVDVQVAMKSTD